MSRGNQAFKRIGLTPQLTSAQRNNHTDVNDLFLHALFARIALSNNSSIEFQTTYNKESNEIELDIPDESLGIFNQITGMQRGEKFKQYINWLIGSETLPAPASTYDSGFISNFEIWVGATIAAINQDTLVYFLPSVATSIVGFNRMVGNVVDGSGTLYLQWAYDSGSNSSFQLKINVSITDVAGNVTNLSNVITPSTFNLIKGDIRETEAITISPGSLAQGDIVSIMIHRNYVGHADPQTDLVGLVGARLVFE